MAAQHEHVRAPGTGEVLILIKQLLTVTLLVPKLFFIALIVVEIEDLRVDYLMLLLIGELHVVVIKNADKISLGTSALNNGAHLVLFPFVFVFE